MKKNLRNVILTVFGLASIFLLSTCQIGLGEAVDVQPPTVFLNSPQADALVRDTFIMDGTYADDLSVGGISITLKEVSTNVEYKQINAVIKPNSDGTKGTWTCSIDPKELGILDGTYVATVSAMDTYLHTGTATQTFSIDNTAPLIVLTSPSSTTLDNPTSYGQVFSVEGKAADDSDVDSIDAIIYDENGVEVARKTITNVSTQIQIDVATWGGVEDGFYEKIYGNNQEAGTKNYKLGLIAYDGARKVPAEENDRGNATSVFYMNNDFAEIDGFKTSIAYNILNGTAKVASGNPYETWEKALEDKKIEQATFSLNPVNNPYFDIQNYEPLGTQNPDGSNSIDLDVETYSFMNKNKLTVNLYVGRDKKAIKTETIGIYLLPCDRYGNLLENETKVTLLEPYKDKNGNIIGVDNTSQITTVGSTSYRWSSESINVKDIDGLNIGKYYIFDVVAYDYNGVGIRNDNKYGIKMTSTSAAPIIQITEPGVTKSVASSKPFVVKGLVKTSAEITGIKVFKNIQDNLIEGLDFQTMEEGKTNAEALAITEGIVLNTEESTDVLKIYNYAFTVPSIEDESYTVIIYASDTNGQSASKEITVSNDKEAPKFDSVASITPYVDVEEGDGGNKKIVQKVNGLVNIKQLISDNVKVEKVWYSTNEVYPTEENHWTEYTDEIKTTFTLNIDTKDFDNDEGVGERIIYLKAQDTAGNVTENGKTEADALIKLIIDQKTDAPRISLSNVTLDGTVCPDAGFTADELKAAKQKVSIFGTKANNYILGTVEDDDGIDTVSVWYCTGSKWDENSKKPLLEANVEGKTTYNIKAKLPETEGAYLIKVDVKDIAQQTDFASTTIEPFLVAVDNGAPVLEVKTESGVFKSGSFAVTGTIDDPTAVLKRYTTEDCEGEGTVIATSGGSWTDTINAAGNIYKFWYKATDAYSQTTTKAFDFKYDPSAPKFNITEIQAEDVSEKFGYATKSNQYAGYDAETNATAKEIKYGNLTDYFTVKGSVKEGDSDSEANVSGLGSYFYYYVGSTLPTKTNGHYTPVDSTGKLNAGWNTSTITKQEGKDPAWEAPIKFTNFKNGSSVYICFAAIDNAGNISLINDNPSTVLTVTIDTESPTYSGNPVLTQGETTTIKVLAKDNVSGLNVDSTTVQRNGEQITLKTASPEQGTESEYTSLTYTIAAEDLIVGENKFTIKIKDKAGYTTTSSEVKINNVAPVFSDNSEGFPTDGVYQSKDSSGNIFSYIKKIDAGLVSSAKVVCGGDNNKLKSVSYIDTIDGTAGSKVDLTLDANNKFTITTDLSSYENKVVSRTIEAENIYGQKSEWKYSFNVDNSAPELKLADSKIDEDAMSSDFDKIWFKETMLAINGAFVENGSGISKILYKINDGEEETIISLKQNNEETFKTTISGLTSDTTNTLKIWAVDNVGNKSEEKEFKINVDTSAPIVEKPTATTTQVSTLSENDVIIKVKASDALSGIDSVLISCSGINTDDISSENKDGEYSFTIPYEKFETRNYSFNIVVKDKVGNVAQQQTIEIKADKTIPEVDITTLTPTVLNSKGKETVNGKIKVSGTVKDETELKELQLIINDSENPRVQSDLKTTYKNYEFEIDTKDLENTLKLTLVATDSFGNKSEEKTKEIIIDQTLDAPKISLSNVTTDGEEWEKVQYPENGFTVDGLKVAKQNASVFGTTSNNYILGTVEDDDGIAKVSVLCCTGSEWDENSKETLLEEEVKGKTTYNIKAKLPETEGAHLIKIVVEDSKGETSYSTTTINPFLIGIDNGAPNLEVKTESGVFYSGTVTVTGTMDDAAAELYRSDKEEKITVGEGGIWEDTINISPDQTTFDYTYTATDEYNQSTTRNFSFKYDPTEPRFSITEIQGSSDDKFEFNKDYSGYIAEENPTAKVLKYGNLTDYFTVKGTVKDDWKEDSSEANTSGIGSYFYYYVGELSNASDTYNPVGDDRKTPINGWKSCTVTKREGEDPSWEAPISFKDFVNGNSVNIYFAAVDNAGNVSIIKDNPSAVLTVVIDQNPPTVKTPSFDIENSKIKVLALDKESNIDEKSIVITRNGESIILTDSKVEFGEETVTEVEGENQTSKEYKSITLTIAKEDLVEGKNKFIISIKDLAGNTVKTNEIVIDNNAPTFPSDKRNTGIPKTAYVKDNCSYVKEFFETTATINCEGTNNKLGKVYYSDVDSEGNVIVENTELEVKDKNISISKSTDTDKAKYEGKIVTRTVIAENIYGIKSEPWTFTFNADFTLPRIVSTTVDSKEANYDGWFNKTTLSLNGTCTDENSGISYVTYKLGEKEGEIYPSGENKEVFAANIGGFAEGSNILNLSVTDNAGNTSNAISKVLKIDTTLPKLLETVAPDAAEDSDVSSIWYRFKDESGESKWEKFEGSILTNVTKDIELTGAFEDKNDDILQSGVKNITIKVNSKEVAATVYEKVDETWTEKPFNVAEEGRWYAVIPVESLENVDSECKATVSIVDNAENEGITKDVIFQIDTEPPTVTVEMPSKDSVLNGNNIFSGKVVDKNNVQSIELFYVMSDSETAPTKFTGFSLLGKKVVGEDDVSLSDVTSWKFEKNVNELLAEGKDKQEMFILPVAYDKAGNNNISGTDKLDEDVSINGKLTQVTVDKHSDRPIIKFTNLSSSGTTAYINATTLNASVEDDDGISEVKVKISETEPDWSTVQKLPISSGGFKVDLGEEGEKTIWFYIKDSAGGEFTTKAAGKLNQPYLLFDGSEEKQDNSEKLVIIKDTQVPTIDTENLAFGFASTEDEAEKNVKVSGLEVDDKKAKLGTKNLAGGTKRQFIAFEVPASDGGSGIDSVKVVVASETNKSGTTYTCELSSGKYYSEAIDVKELSGIQTVTFRVKDKSGLESTSTKQIIIDNTPPTLEVISPLPDDEVTGVVTLTGTTNDDDSNISIVKYLVLNNKYVTDPSDQTPDVESKEFGDCENKGSSFRSWKFELNNLPSSDAELNAEENGYTNIDHTEQDIYTLPIYFYVEDSLGNGTIITDETIKYNPFGDRPTAEINYPTGKQTEKANVNGAIRVTGVASDNVSEKEVYIQLDVNQDGNFNNDDITILDACLDAGTTGNNVYTIVRSATEYKTGAAANADMSAIDNDFWGIKVNGTKSWNYTINKFSELLKESNKVAGAEGKYAVNIRAVAVDNNYKFGNWSETQYVEFDTNIPSIGTHNKNVIEYAEDGTTVKATKAYISDMYLKGTAALELSVEDKEGIKQVMYYVAATEEGLASATGTIINNLGEEQTWGSGATETKGYIVSIPLSADSTASGAKYVKVVATKDSDTETTAYEKFSVNFDNSAPTLRNISLNGVKYDDSDKKVVNSNGTYFTIASEVEDDGGSGFDKFVFYYYREGKSENPNRIYNPMIDSASLNGGQPINKGRVNINDLNSMEIAGKSIYGSKQTVNINADKRTITFVNESDHIRTGGLVNIDGNWITIESVSGTTVTLKTDSSVTGSEEVFFAYAQVIDNTGSEKTNASGDLTSGDDGDQMAESIIKNLNVWTVDASFHSNYIPDGPGKFVVFAFDKAGNVVSGEYEASVQNNAPRLTRVMLATDLNGDNEYQYDNSNGDPVNNLSENATANGAEFGEFAFYSTLNNMGEASNIATVSLPAGRDAFIVKNKLLVVPEFVGGNGDLQYTYKIADTLEDATMSKDSDENIDLKSFDSNVVIDDVKGNFDDSNTTIKDVEGKTLTTTSKKFVLSNDNFAGKESWTKEGKKTKYLAATFWDSTPETTQGEDSCYALLKMPLIINLIDDTNPTAHIIPFYWNSKEDGSFVYENGLPQGHIDIEQNPTKDTRPGVSGEVYIEGEAWDDTRLGGIWMTTPGTDETYQVAKYEGGTWSKVTDDWPENWKNFEILEDSGIKQSGHTVKWRFHVNMTPYGIKAEQKVSVQAKDAKADTPNVSATNPVQTVKDALTPTYIMKFVPYIKSIYATDVGSANRSRLGKFPVRAGADMTIEGMNFASGASYTVNFYKSNADGTGPDNVVSETASGTFVTDSDGLITVTAPEYSRWVEVVVTPKGGTAVSTKNNSNTNGGYNIEAGYVAKEDDKGLSQANTAGTNFWTDDRYISVWNVGTGLPGSMTPHSGVVKKISIENSGGDTVGGGYMYKQPDGLTQVDSISNANDHYYAALSSDDLKVYGYVGPKEYDTHGDNVIWNGSEACFQVPIDAMDMTIINGLPYYVMQDSFLSGDSANVWGPGLFISREGAGWNRDKLSKHGQTLEEEKCYFIIERQGTSNQKAADRATMEANLIGSKDGYDAILKQFKNPKIVGYYDSTESLYYTDANSGQRVTGVDYVYVSYYDSHSKCLKYAAYKVGHRFNEWIDMYQWGYHNNRSDIVPLMHSAKHIEGSGAAPNITDLDSQTTIEFNNMITGNAVVAGWDSLQASPTIKEKAGEWSDIMIDPTTKYPVIIYYNETKRSLEVAFGNSQAPSTGQICSTEGVFSAENTTAWTKTKGITPNSKIDFGRYVSAEMDKNGNIHATAQDVTNNKLYYIFLKKSTSYSSTFKVVDSTAAVGMWTDIQLKNSAGDTNGNWYGYGPTISYMNKEQLNSTNAIKIAYCSSDGTWESITDPTSYPGLDQKTSVMVDVYEGGTVDKSNSVTSNGVKAQIGVGFNSDMYILDFLRGEE